MVGAVRLERTQFRVPGAVAYLLAFTPRFVFQFPELGPLIPHCFTRGAAASVLSVSRYGSVSCLCYLFVTPLAKNSAFFQLFTLKALIAVPDVVSDFLGWINVV